MSADILFDLIREFTRKDSITNSEMELLRAQAKKLDLSEEELQTLINEIVEESNKREQRIKDEQEDRRRIKEEEAESLNIRKANRKKSYAIFKRRLKITAIVLTIITLLIFIITFSYNYFIEESIWDKAQKTNTYSSYQNYLYKYPEGRHILNALRMQEEAVWIEAKQVNTIAAYENYISLFANGEYLSEARLKKEDAFWHDATTSNKIDSYYNYIKLYPNGKYKDKIWEIVSPLIIEPSKVGLLDFSKLYFILEQLELSLTIVTSDRYRVAKALKNYLDNNKTSAISIFESIITNNPSSIEAELSKDILKSPDKGRIEYDTQPFHFKGTWKNWGQDHGGLLIRLLSVDILISSIRVSFSMKAKGNRSDCLIYATRTISEPFGSNCEKLYIIDDIGKKYYSTTNWTGGNSTHYNSCANRICFNPNEEVTLFAEFPMISPGATALKFVSPNPDNAGHQYEWTWDNIKVKNTPFE